MFIVQQKMIIIDFLNKILAQIVIVFIKIYQITISPDKWIFSSILKWKICSHQPHCSQYSIQVLKRYGFWPGIVYAGDRVLSCKASMSINYDPAHYKIVFFSSAPIWVPFLQELSKDNRFEVVGVITQCDKPAGRGMKICENIIKAKSKEIFWEDIDESFIQTPTKINPDKSEEWKKFYQWLKNKEADFLVVIAYGKIIPQSILDLCNIAPINVHGSLLPKYRGASPIQSIFLNNETETGITIMKMDSQMDTGNMIDILKFKIDFSRNSQNIISEIMDKWPKFLNDTLRDFGKKELWEVPQNHDKATYCNKIEKEDWLIDPQKDSIQDMYNKYRAFFLWPKIFFIHNDKRIIIEELELDQNLFNSQKDNVLIDKSWSLNPCVKNIKLKPEWKKPMNRESFTAWYLK